MLKTPFLILHVIQRFIKCRKRNFNWKKINKWSPFNSESVFKALLSESVRVWLSYAPVHQVSTHLHKTRKQKTKQKNPHKSVTGGLLISHHGVSKFHTMAFFIYLFFYPAKLEMYLFKKKKKGTHNLGQ